MRLWHYKLIPVLPKDMLVSQWRECIAIKRQWEKGTLKHRLVSYVIDEKAKDKFNMLCHCEDFIIENYEQSKEIERLNNIINELEKWLNKEIKRLDEMQDTYDKYGKKKDANIIYISGAYNEVLDKIQELKGEDK